MAAVIRYMGTKRSLAPQIAEMISSRHPKATVIDAFAGMCAVGTALAPAHTVVANDAMAFAETVARALLVAPSEVPTPLEARRDLTEPFLSNWNNLRAVLAERLEKEDKALRKVVRPNGWKYLEVFTLEELAGDVPRNLDGLPKVSAYRSAPLTVPYALFSSYYASTYLGVKQAATVDSLRFAIDQASPARRDFYLLALLQAVSTCAAAPGHLAQFLIPRTSSNTKYIARMRRRSILQRFSDALLNLNLPDCVDRESNAAFRSDATQFLREKAQELRMPTVIYADPPYSRAQYSRYYHVLETLVLYDYPCITGKGRYRVDRFNTDFCRSAQVGTAMRSFVGAAAASGAPLYLSYPKNGLLHKIGDSLPDILQCHYSTVEIVLSVPLAHSTMGGAPGTSAVDVTENVYYAE